MLEVAERFADGRATDDELETAWENSRAVVAALSDADFALPATGNEDDSIWNALEAAEAAKAAVSEAPEEAFSTLSMLLGYDPFVVLLRDVFGPATRVVFDPPWLSPAVKALAESIYEERDFALLPGLGDALEDAGCTDATILEHCRRVNGEAAGPEPARVCWVLDLLLGKS